MEVSLLDKVLIKILNDKLYRELDKILQETIPTALMEEYEHSVGMRLYEENDYPRSILLRMQMSYTYAINGCIHIYGNYKVMREIVGELYDESVCKYIENKYLKNMGMVPPSIDHSSAFIATVADSEPISDACIEPYTPYIKGRKLGLVGVKNFYYSSIFHDYDDDIIRLSSTPSMTRLMAYLDPNSVCNAKLNYKNSNIIYQTLYCIYRKYFENFNSSKWKIELEE